MPTYGKAQLAAELERHFPTTPHSETVSARLQARWDADPHDPVFRFTWADGTVGYMPRPAESAIGSDCLAWRKKILKGEPLFKAREPRSASPNWGRVLKPLRTVWRRSPPTYRPDPLQPEKRIKYVTEGSWEHDGERQQTVPVRVRCPSCNRPIRLSRWWEHGCEKGIVTSDWCFAPWAEATAGAAMPVYEDEAPAPAAIAEVPPPAAETSIIPAGPPLRFGRHRFVESVPAPVPDAVARQASEPTPPTPPVPFLEEVATARLPAMVCLVPARPWRRVTVVDARQVRV